MSLTALVSCKETARTDQKSRKKIFTSYHLCRENIPFGVLPFLDERGLSGGQTGGRQHCLLLDCCQNPAVKTQMSFSLV